MIVRTLQGLGALIVLALLACLIAYDVLQPPRLPVPARTSVVIEDVTVVNPGLGRRTHVDIHFDGGRIRRVAATGSWRPPADARRLRCPGCFALPGLLDMHTHLPPRVALGNDRLFALLFLAHGVTGIRELGSADGSAYAVRDAIARGDFPGPRVFSCGRVLDGDPPTRPNNVVLRTPAEGRAAVREAAAHGARCIKLYNMLRRDVVLAIADEAARARLPIVAHVPHSVSLLDAPYIADVQHFTGVPEVRNPALLGLDDYVNDDFAALTDARIAAVVAAALRQHTIHTPALVNEDVRRTLGDPLRYPTDPGLRELPTFWTGVWRGIWHAPNAGPARSAVYERFRRRERDLLRALFAAGVPIYAGTDTLMPFVVPGAALHAELREFVAVGRSPEQALVTATTAPGRFWKDATFGRIDAGLPADIVLYRADPTRSLDALSRIDTVVADGRVYPIAQLRAGLARYRAHFHGAFYQRVMDTIVGLAAGDYDPAQDTRRRGIPHVD